MLKLPEKALISAKALERVTATATALGLSQEHAQKALDETNAVVADYVEEQKASFATTTKGWIDVVKADAEMGGDKFAATIQDAAKPIDRFFTPAFKKALSDTGFGNHPELVRGFARIGRAMSEDKIVRPGPEGGTGGGRSYEDIFYGDKDKTPAAS